MRKLILFLSLIIAVSTLSAQKKAILIGLDGLRPDALQKANTPYMDKMMKEGQFCLNVTTDSLTNSAPCWSSMTTGVWSDKHGVIDNSFDNNNLINYPDFIKRLSAIDSKPFHASIVEWRTLIKLHGKLNFDMACVARADEDVVDLASYTLRKKDVEAMFIHIDGPDRAGHHFCFSPNNENYIAEIERCDDYVKTIVETIKSRKNYKKEDWLIIVATDHGGTENRHGLNIPEHRTTFMIVNGNNVETTGWEKKNSVDIGVSILDYMGVDVSKLDLDGTSFIRR